jgi:hypothetical protein
VIAAALADLSGGNGMALLSERDPLRREVRLAVANRAAEERVELAKRQAIWTANAMAGKAPGG